MVSPEHDDALPGRQRGPSPLHLVLGLFGVVTLTWVGVFLLLKSGQDGAEEAPAATAGPPGVVEDAARGVPEDGVGTAPGVGAPATEGRVGDGLAQRWEPPALEDSATLTSWARWEDRWPARARRLDALIHDFVRLIEASPSGEALPSEAAEGEAVAVPAMARGPQPMANGLTAEPSFAPRLAIVIDDWGYPWQEAERFLELPFPLTVAVIPHLPLSRQHARQALASGHEVILHLPMEPLADSVPLEPDTLRVGMSPVEILSIVDRALRSVPEATGMNNHMGSKATAEPGVMHPLLADAARRGLFFLDSYTSPRSVVSQVAAAHGVPVAVNRVFLDHHADEEFVVGQLYKAMDVARAEGQAVAIGHVKPGTYKALARVLPEIEAEGIRLVYASDLIRRLPPPGGPIARRTERWVPIRQAAGPPSERPDDEKWVMEHDAAERVQRADPQRADSDPF